MSATSEDTPVWGKGRRSLDATADGMPWWIKAIGLIGVPSVIALYLVYAMVNTITPALMQGQQTMNTIVSMLSTVNSDHVASRSQNDRMIAVLTATCVNAAKDAQERERCFR